MTRDLDKEIMPETKLLTVDELPPLEAACEALKSVDNACEITHAKPEFVEYVLKCNPATVSALCATVRALEARLKQCEGSRRVHEIDNHHNALACGYCAGPLKNELTRLVAIDLEFNAYRSSIVSLIEAKAAEWENEETVDGLFAAATAHELAKLIGEMK